MWERLPSYSSDAQGRDTIMCCRSLKFSLALRIRPWPILRATHVDAWKATTNEKTQHMRLQGTSAFMEHV